MNKKKLLLWCGYTFANSIVFINFLVYFSKWLVIDGGISDLAYNMSFVVMAVAMLMCAPALAVHTDSCGNRKTFLNLATVGTVVFYAVAASFAIYGLSPVIAFLAFVLGQFCYQMAFVFYDPMLNDLSDKSHRTRASGLGQFCSNFGMIFGLAVSLPMIEAGGRLASLIPSVAMFAVLALPMMLFYRENCRPKKVRHKIKLGFDWKRFRGFLFASAAAPILIAFFFYTNALNTITNNYSIYAGNVLNMSDETTSAIMIVVQIAAALGALLIGFVGDRIGARRCLMWILWTWLALIGAIAVTTSTGVFFAIAGALGLTIGAGWAVSRAYISANLEKDNVGYGFSFYTLFERFSSIIGPLTWGGILALGGGYRMAMLAMMIFIAVGLVILGLAKSSGRKIKKI